MLQHGHGSRIHEGNRCHDPISRTWLSDDGVMWKILRFQDPVPYVLLRSGAQASNGAANVPQAATHEWRPHKIDCKKSSFNWKHVPVTKQFFKIVNH